MEVKGFLFDLLNSPKEIKFEQVMDVIDANYDFVPTSFTNGDLRNEAGENNGSCKIFAFGLLHKLTEEEALSCFGKFYRVDVLGNPDDKDHQNIRNFSKTGWGGIKFEQTALIAKDIDN